MPRFVRLLCLLVPALAVLATCPAVAGAADTRIVAVSYFNNRTNQKDLDVLKKGLADMVLTDLAEVDGLEVVERDRLEDILGEIELQKHPYFDKKTAIKLGKGLKAHFIITGQFHVYSAKLRIDVRMIDIVSGKVVLSTHVKGKEDEVFELEQQLIEKFVGKLDRTHDPSPRPRTKVPDVDTLVEYSKGIDLADRGMYKEAEKAMARVMRSAPTFALARVKRDQFIAALAAAKTRRTEIRTDRSVSLAKSSEDFLRQYKVTELNKEEAQHYLAYRILRGRFLIRALEKHLAPEKGVRLIMTGHEKKAKRLLEAYYANFELLIKEHDKYRKRYGKVLPNGRYDLDTSFELPRDRRKVAREAGIESRFSNEGRNPRLALAQFLLLGYIIGPDGKRHYVGPTLSDSRPKKYRKLGYQLLRKVWSNAHKLSADDNQMQTLAIDALEAHAEALLLRGDQEKGIAKLQEILDRYPTSFQFKNIERRIQQELGLKHNHSVSTRDRYYKGLKTCKDMDLRVGWGGVIHARKRTMGMSAALSILVEMEKHCKGKPKLHHLWPYIYKNVAMFGSRHKDCRMFDRYMTEMVNLGGSRGDAAAYRRNNRDCPPPASP